MDSCYALSFVRVSCFTYRSKWRVSTDIRRLPSLFCTRSCKLHLRHHLQTNRTHLCLILVYIHKAMHQSCHTVSCIATRVLACINSTLRLSRPDPGEGERRLVVRAEQWLHKYFRKICHGHSNCCLSSIDMSWYNAQQHSKRP